MEIYNYHPVTSEFVSQGLADEDPLTPDNWLIPANATTMQPPSIQEKQVAVFLGGEWVVKPDHRGETWFDAEGNEVKIDQIGIIPDASWTIEKPPEPYVPRTQFTSLEFLDRFTEEEQLTVVQATMQSAAVKLWYDRLLAASFVDLEDPRTEAGIDALISAGLIAADRKAALLQPA